MRVFRLTVFFILSTMAVIGMLASVSSSGDAEWKDLAKAAIFSGLAIAWRPYPVRHRATRRRYRNE